MNESAIEIISYRQKPLTTFNSIYEYWLCFLLRKSNKTKMQDATHSLLLRVPLNCISSVDWPIKQALCHQFLAQNLNIVCFDFRFVCGRINCDGKGKISLRWPMPVTSFIKHTHTFDFSFFCRLNEITITLITVEMQYNDHPALKIFNYIPQR